MIEPDTVLRVGQAAEEEAEHQGELAALHRTLLIESLRAVAAPLNRQLERVVQTPTAAPPPAAENDVPAAPPRTAGSDAHQRRRSGGSAAAAAADIASLVSQRRSLLRERSQALGQRSAVELVCAALQWQVKTVVALARKTLIESEALFRSVLAESRVDGGHETRNPLSRKARQAQNAGTPEPTKLCVPPPVDSLFLRDRTATATMRLLSELARPQPSAKAPNGRGIAHTMALRELLALRQSAAEVLAAFAWHNGTSDEPRSVWQRIVTNAVSPAAAEQKTDLGTTGGAAPIPKTAFDPLLPPLIRLRARLLAAQLAATLAADHGPRWWTKKEARSQIQALCARSPELTGEELAAAIGAPAIDPEAALARIAHLLVHSPPIRTTLPPPVPNHP